MKIEKYNEKYANEIAELFCESVHAIDASLYTEKQKKAWAPRPPDYEFWQRRLGIKKPFLSIVDGRIAGFVELEIDGHIDCLYVHPAYQRRGFGSKLLGYAIQCAEESGLQRLYVEASKAAYPLFSKMGFRELTENIIERRGVHLVNYSMELVLE